MTVRELVVKFGFKVDQNSENQAKRSIQGIKSMAAKVLGGIGIVLSIKGISELAETAAEAEALKSQFTQVFGEMEKEAASKLEAIADDTGVAVNRMKGSFVQIAAFAKTTGMETADALALSDRAMQAVADSAAFYDRSMEEVTDSLQSFLKGNFEQDSALGLSCTEVTRNTAANALYGKSFKDLAEDQKQLTLLKMVEDANKASGAIGQAARESDTWTNQLGNLKQSLKDLKAAGGSTILKPAVAVLKLLNFMVKGTTKAIERLTAENGLLTRATERYHALVKRVQPAIDRMVQTLSKGLNKGIEVVKSVTDRLGGAENVLRILAVAAGAFLLVMNWGKIISGARMFLKLLSGIGRLFSLANLKILAVVSIVAILALIVEDFIHFLIGNESVIGACFEKAGIDADKMREKIKSIWENLKVFFVGIWNAIKTAAAPILEVIKKMIEGIFGEDLFAGLGNGVAGIIEFLERIADALAKNKGLQDFLGKAVVAIVAVITAIKIAIPVIQGVIALIGVVKGVIAGAGVVIGLLTSPIGLVIAAIVALIAIGILLYKNWEEIKGFAVSIWTAICDFLQGVWSTITSVISGAINGAYNTIVSVLTAIYNFFSSIFSGIASFVSSTFSNILSSVISAVSNIKDAIVNGFNVAIDWIKRLPAQAVQWGADFIGGLKDGILSGVKGIVDAVKGVAGKIKSFLHFSVPDEGPLTDYESWMPDFMGGLAKGISENEGTVLDKVKGLAGGIQALMSAATAKVSTATTGTINNTASSVTQNVNIENSYSGGSAETQKNVSKAMKKSATDATTQMARGLAYARG